MQPFIQALPLTALNDALRGGHERRRVAGRGLRGEVAILAAWGGFSFALALQAVPVAVTPRASGLRSAGYDLDRSPS